MQRFKCMCVTDSITALGVITLEPFIADSLSVPQRCFIVSIYAAEHST